MVYADVVAGLPMRFVVPGLTADAPHVARHVCDRGRESFWLRDHYDPDVLPVVLSRYFFWISAKTPGGICSTRVSYPGLLLEKELIRERLV
jgi:hypothetical protein